MKISRRLRQNALVSFAIVVLIIWSLGPIVWNIFMSVSSEVNLLQKPPRLSINELQLSNYATLLTRSVTDSSVGIREGIAFRQAFKNSIVVCIMSTIVSTVISILAGYAFARLHIRGKSFLFLIIILTMPIPVVVIAIPLIKIMTNLRLMDTYLGLTILYTSFILSLTIWMATSYIRTIPSEIEDAAYIDGCSRWQAFLRVIVPLSLPVIGAIAIISFLNAWSQFFLPLIFAPGDAKQLTVVISEFVSKTAIKKGLMAAAGVLAMVPPAIIVIFLNRFIISGLTTGATKE